MRILILGCGVGGLVAANELRKKLGKEHKITVVDRKVGYEFTPSYLWLMMGWREPRQITRDLNLLSRKGIKYINNEVLKIDPANRLVKTKTGDLAYDFLVVAMGAELAPETVPGLTDAAHTFYDLEAAMATREAIRRFSGGKVTITIASTPFRCPAAPYEAALLMDYGFRTRGIRDKVDFQLFTPEPLPMPVAGPAIGNLIKQMLEARGIEFHPGFKPVSIDSKNKEISFEKGERYRYDFLVAVPPHRSPSAVKESDLTDGGAWIPVEKRSLKTRHPEIYAIGDVAGIKLFDGMMLPKAGVFAHSQAAVVASNIAAEVNGSGARREFDGKGSCWIEAGFGKAGFASGEFYSEPRVVNVKWPGVR
ncbi:MAG TPA: FAD/NAD(P)-binding oxidoreductase, partial [Candidatus Bathyarchaeia archaeon]|nr:FAD/NAD(P)-binding oxidoreductase [Candidatus Bathyarchaeia archaeon]